MSSGISCWFGMIWFYNFYLLLVFPVSDLRKNEYLPRTFRKNFRVLLNPGFKKLPRKFMFFRRLSLQTNLTVKKKIIYAFQKKLRVFELTPRFRVLGPWRKPTLPPEDVYCCMSSSFKNESICSAWHHHLPWLGLAPIVWCLLFGDGIKECYYSTLQRIINPKGTVLGKNIVVASYKVLLRPEQWSASWFYIYAILCQRFTTFQNCVVTLQAPVYSP